MIHAVTFFTPPKDKREFLAEVVSEYGKRRRHDGTIEGQDIGYRAKDLAADLRLGQPIRLNGPTLTLLCGALYNAGRDELASRLEAAARAAGEINEVMA